MALAGEAKNKPPAKASFEMLGRKQRPRGAPSLVGCDEPTYKKPGGSNPAPRGARRDRTRIFESTAVSRNVLG